MRCQSRLYIAISFSSDSGRYRLVVIEGPPHTEIDGGFASPLSHAQIYYPVASTHPNFSLGMLRESHLARHFVLQQRVLRQTAIPSVNVCLEQSS